MDVVGFNGNRNGYHNNIGGVTGGGQNDNYDQYQRYQFVGTVLRSGDQVNYVNNPTTESPSLNDDVNT